MRPVTDRFLTTVRGSHAMCARARVVAPGQTGVNPTGTVIPIIVGDVILDSTAEVRATLDLTTEWDFPLDASGLLAPYGNEVFIERGIIYGDGVREWVSQGYFRLYDTGQDTAPNGEIKLGGRDRMSGIIDARVLAPMQFATNTAVSTIFDNLIGEVYPGAVIVYDFDAAGTVFTSSHVIEEDRYAFLKDICDSLGKVMYWDYAGRLQVRTAPNPATPVVTVNHGRDGVLAKLSRSLNRDTVYNAVVATGEAPGEAPPVRAVALDLKPASPTYWYGPFGKVPKFYSSTFITTTGQARTAAAAMLARALGLPYNVDFTMVPNPALEPLDAVELAYSDRNDSETHVIESMTIPLDAAGALTAKTRQVIR